MFHRISFFLPFYSHLPYHIYSKFIELRFPVHYCLCTCKNTSKSNNYYKKSLSKIHLSDTGRHFSSRNQRTIVNFTLKSKTFFTFGLETRDCTDGKNQLASLLRVFHYRLRALRLVKIVRSRLAS